MSDDIKAARDMYKGQKYMDFEFPEEFNMVTIRLLLCAILLVALTSI